MCACAFSVTWWLKVTEFLKLKINVCNQIKSVKKLSILFCQSLHEDSTSEVAEVKANSCTVIEMKRFYILPMPIPYQPALNASASRQIFK